MVPKHQTVCFFGEYVATLLNMSVYISVQDSPAYDKVLEDYIHV